MWGGYLSSTSHSSSGFISTHRNSPASSENSSNQYLTVATESSSSLSPSLSVNAHSPLSSNGAISPSRQFIPRSATRRQRSRSRPSSLSSNSPPPSPNTTTSSSIASSISPHGGASRRRQQMYRQNTAEEFRSFSESWHHTKILARKYSESSVDSANNDAFPSARISMLPSMGYLKSFFRGRPEMPKVQAPTIEIIGDEEENDLRSIGMIKEQPELIIECLSDTPNRPNVEDDDPRQTLQDRRSMLLRGQTVPSYYQTRDTAAHFAHSGDSAVACENSRNSDVSQHSYHVLKSVRTKSSSSAANSETGTKISHSEKPCKRSVDQRIFVVWLERNEDKHHFPLEDMFAVTDDGSCVSARSPSYRPDFVVIYLNRFETNLVRVNVDGVWTKCGPPGPLCDGMVVSLTSLPTLLRLTVMNVTRRKAVELENNQMVHNKRKLAIQDLCKKYAAKTTYSEFLERLVTFS